jgi:hypothetical protein
MAANWLRGWMKSTRRADKRIPARRQELCLDALEDRTVPATAVALTDAVAAPALPGHDAEVDVSINPTNLDNVVGTAIYAQFFNQGQGANAVTFTGNAPYAPVQVPLTGAASIGDPILTHFRDGRLLFTQMEFDGVNPGTIGMFSAVSNDGGLTYTKGTITPVGSGDDKNDQAHGPNINNLAQEMVYFTWHRGNSIFASTSTDGINWTAPVQVSADGGNIHSIPAVDSQGRAFIIWDDFSTPGQTSVRVSQSVDGGVTWGAETTAAVTSINPFQDTTAGGGGGKYFIPAQPNRGIQTLGGFDIDRSGGPFDGRMYLAFLDQDRDEAAGAARHNNINVYLTFSDDQGATWSEAVEVQDVDTTNSSLFPRLAVDQSTGNVAITFYDGRNAGAGNQLMEYWGVLSDPGGQSFTPNFMISQGQSNMGAGQGDGFYYGDYTGLSFEQGRLAAIWADNSNSAGDNPDGTQNADAYIRTFTVGAAAAGRDLVAFDLSRSMTTLYGLDINNDGFVNDDDDFNEKGLEGSLIDAELFDYFNNVASEVGIIAFARRAEALNMTPNGDKFTNSAVDSDGDGETDVLETLKSLTKGGGGYFGTVDVDEDPTILEGVLANILIYADPGDNVVIYTDGASRFDPANSVSLQSLIQAGISVDVVLVGPYQDIVDTDNVEQIARLTGGNVRRLNNFDGRPADGGFPTVVNGGGTGSSGSGSGSFPGNGASGGSGSGSGGSGSGSGGSGSGSGGSGSGGDGNGGTTGGSGSGGGAGASGGETGESAPMLTASAEGDAESDAPAEGQAATTSTSTAYTRETFAATSPTVTRGPLGMLLDGKPAFQPFVENGQTYRWVFMKNGIMNGAVKMQVDSQGKVMFTKPATPAPTQTPTPAPGNFPGPQPIYRPEDYGLAYLTAGGTVQSGSPTSGDGTTQEPPKDDVPSNVSADDPLVTGGGSNTGGASSGGSTTVSSELPTLDPLVPAAPLDGEVK